MANWIDLYRSKLTTPEQAVSVVESGDWIDYGWCVNTPGFWTRPWPSAMRSWRT